MEIQRETQILNEKTLDFIESVNNCPLCGTSLQMTHQFDYLLQKVHEEAHCPSCDIRTRASDFTLQ